MAILHRATLEPSKPELLASFLDGPVTILGAYRYDDPAGQVGVEGFVVETQGGAVRHVVLAYRAEELAEAAAHLVGTTEHSALGTRWVYDGRHDPVVQQCLEAALAGRMEQALEEVFDGDRSLGVREPSARIRRVEGAAADGPVVLDAPEPAQGRLALVLTWGGGEGAVVLG